MADKDFDQSEKATPYKLSEARKKGNVAKSQDFTASVMLVAMVASIYTSGWVGFHQLAKLLQAVLVRANRFEWGVDGVAAWLGDLALAMLHILSPLFLTLVITAVLVALFQSGPVFTFHPLSPDLERINPAAGLKRLFSMRTAYEAVKSMIKLLVLSAVAYFAIRESIPLLLALSELDPKQYAQTLLGLTAGLLTKMVLTLFVIALFDFAYTRWEFFRNMRMSKRDVKDESKNRDGDPRIRSRIRELRKEMLKRSKAMRNLPNADVLITNPTHIAVALTYRHGASSAPQLIAKGAGDLAHKMRIVAGRHHIPVVQNKVLARALFREVEYDGFVPEKLYAQVAKIMVWVYTMREAKRASARGA